MFFTGYERDEETDLDFAQARMYSYNLGRFNSPDLVRMLKARIAEPQHWNLYVYGRNNPVVMVDVAGEFPYTFYVRSFAPSGAFSGSGFHDDGSGFSTDTSSETTSRIQQKVTIDPATQSLRDYQVNSSPTVWNGIIQAVETPTGYVTEYAFEVQNEFSIVRVKTEYSGQNAITKRIPFIGNAITPAIDVQATIVIAENTKIGQVVVSVNITGDRFPATEAFILDQKGNKVFVVGANAYGNPLNGLPGNPRLPVASASLVINIDKEGNFTGVVYQGKMYSVADWNKNALATQVQIEDRENQRCNCLQ